MLCKKCEKVLEGKQLSYCSPRCSKLHLKSLYKKRNKERLNKQRNIRNAMFARPIGAKLRKAIMDEQPVCNKCGTMENLEIHHIKPVVLGGSNKENNLMTLCHIHHYEFEMITRKFFEEAYESQKLRRGRG